MISASAASVVVRTRFVQSRLSRGRRSARVRHRKNRQPLSRLAPGAPALGEPARAARQGRRGAGDEIVRPSPPREAAVTRFPVLTLRTRPPAAGYRLGAHPGVPADSPDHMGHASQLIPRSSTPDFGLCATPDALAPQARLGEEAVHQVLDCLRLELVLAILIAELGQVNVPAAGQ